MATLEFTKMHGCGNDYIYIIADKVRPVDPAKLSIRLSDRRFGIGGDGLILLCPSQSADARMEMYNADGSRGDMCGNGIRCLARMAFERGLVRANPMVVETDAGLKTVALHLEGRRVVSATVDMGEPILDGRIRNSSRRSRAASSGCGCGSAVRARPGPVAPARARRWSRRC